jgi:hypothetical protein
MNKFIHQSSALCLALIMLARIMAMPLSLLDYSLNKSFIINNLCENRLKAEIHCAGKCYLSKQLSKGNESQNPKEQKGSAKNLVIDFYEPADRPDLNNIIEPLVVSFFFKTPCISGMFPENIFHPPIA